MYELIIHTDASADLRGILAVERPGGLRLVAFIQELRADQNLLSKIVQKRYGGRPADPRPKDAVFNSGIWQAAKEAGMEMRRVRCFYPEAMDYRMIISVHPEVGRYVLLAVTKKAEHDDPHDESFNYELDHPIALRITASYRQLLGGW